MGGAGDGPDHLLDQEKRQDARCLVSQSGTDRYRRPKLLVGQGQATTRRCDQRIAGVRGESQIQAYGRTYGDLRLAAKSTGPGLGRDRIQQELLPDLGCRPRQIEQSAQLVFGKAACCPAQLQSVPEGIRFPSAAAGGLGGDAGFDVAPLRLVQGCRAGREPTRCLVQGVAGEQVVRLLARLIPLAATLIQPLPPAQEIPLRLDPAGEAGPLAKERLVDDVHRRTCGRDDESPAGEALRHRPQGRIDRVQLRLAPRSTRVPLGRAADPHQLDEQPFGLGLAELQLGESRVRALREGARDAAHRVVGGTAQRAARTVDPDPGPQLGERELQQGQRIGIARDVVQELGEESVVERDVQAIGRQRPADHLLQLGRHERAEQHRRIAVQGPDELGCRGLGLQHGLEVRPQCRHHLRGSRRLLRRQAGERGQEGPVLFGLDRLSKREGLLELVDD